MPSKGRHGNRECRESRGFSLSCVRSTAQAAMRLLILAAGKPALGYAREGIEEYLKRLKYHGQVSLELVKAGSSEEVSKRLLEKSEGMFRVVMDERGERLTTAELAKRFGQLEL